MRTLASDSLSLFVVQHHFAVSAVTCSGPYPVLLAIDDFDNGHRNDAFLHVPVLETAACH